MGAHKGELDAIPPLKEIVTYWRTLKPDQGIRFLA